MTPAARERLHGLGLLLAAGLLLLGLQAVEPYFFLRDDNATHFLPAYVFAYESVVGQGEIPFLDQHQSLGGTFLAPGQTGVLYAPIYPLAWATERFCGDLRGLIDLIASLHLLAAALGMWRLLRRLATRPAIALPLALAFGVLPFGLLAGRNWVVVTYLLAYLPWNLLLLLRFLERPEARRGVPLALLKALYVSSGYVHLAVLAQLAELFYLGFWAWRRRGAGLGALGPRLAAVYLLAGLLAAPLLLPMWTAKGVSQFRQTRIPAGAITSQAMTAADFAGAQLLAPRAAAIFEAPASLFYLGLPLLGLLLFWRRRGAAEDPRLAAAFATGIFCLLISTRLWIVLGSLPLLSSFRMPFKAFPLAAFFLFVAAARGGELAAGRRPAVARWLLPLLAANLLLQGLLLSRAEWRRPFGAGQLELSVRELREDPMIRRIGDDARVASLGHLDDEEFPEAPRLLGRLYATLAGKYQVAGYDPLISKLNYELSYKAYGIGTIAKPVGLFDPWLERLRRLGVGYLLVDGRSKISPHAAGHPLLRRLASSGGVTLYALPGAWPMVYSGPERRALPFAWRVNGLAARLPPDFPGGEVAFNVAPLPGYRLRIDGRDAGEPLVRSQRPAAAAPPGTREIELRYVDRPFRRGLAAAGAGLALALAWLACGRSLPSARPGGGPPPDAEHRFAEGVEEQRVDEAR